ncbi:MAG: hypothetical protein ACRCZZ_06860 [Phocaeicola sp.]
MNKISKREFIEIISKNPNCLYAVVAYKSLPLEEYLSMHPLERIPFLIEGACITKPSAFSPRKFQHARSSDVVFTTQEGTSTYLGTQGVTFYRKDKVILVIKNSLDFTNIFTYYLI